MKNNLSRRRIMVIVLPCAAWSFLGASVEVAAAQVMAIEEAMEPNGDVQTLDLTSDQKITIYREAREKKSRVAPTWFTAQVGAVVPPMIALYPLPDTILHSDPITKLYQFTRVEDQTVLVDPTKMRVVAVIGPQPAE